MKKNLLFLLLGLVYILSVAGLLMIHVQLIVGRAERRMAMLEILLLLVPVVVFCVCWARGTWIPEEKQPAEPHEPDTGCADIDMAESAERFYRMVDEDGLSEREKEVAWLIYRGFTNRQIAEELFIAETTVKKHVTHIFEKTNVTGRKELKEKWRHKGK